MNDESAELNPSVLDALRSRLRGTTLVRGDHGYDIARRVWNGAIDRHPLSLRGVECKWGCPLSVHRMRKSRRKDQSTCRLAARRGLAIDDGPPPVTVPPTDRYR